jgi:hypothetical protein
MKYKVVFDVGKPYEEEVEEQDLERVLRNFYYDNIEEFPDLDVAVYKDDEDISESEFIQEIISRIIYGDD